MKIICFPHYTCGGLLGDILNDTHSPVGPNGGIQSLGHSVGKIGDTITVYKEFDVNELLTQLQESKMQSWMGTHCWLGNYAHLFENVVNVTTTTYKSKLYRWARAYHLYFKKLDHWTSLTGLDYIDKTRETAKNYFVPFDPIQNQNVINIEFADVVECNPVFVKIFGASALEKTQRWKTINSFLYDLEFWNSYPVKRFYEADYEITQKKFYVYE